MSLIWMDGFENSSLWTRKYAIVGTIATTTGRSGNGIQMTGSTIPASITRLLGSDGHATLVTGFSAQATSANGWADTNGYPLVRFGGDAGVTQHLNFCVSADTGGNIECYRGSTLLGTSSGVTLTTSVNYYIEIKATLNDSTGSVTVKINGTTVLTLTNVDTKNAGTAAVFDSVYLGATNTTTQTVMIDDWYVCNGAGSVYNDFLGDVTVETIRPDGNGNSSQWVGSDANSTDNYLLVDESTYSAADYVESGTTNNKDLYTYGALAASSGSVKGVMVTGVMQKTASASQSARQITRISGTNYNGSSQALTTSDLPYAQVWEQSPATASDWSISEVNGAEFGVEAL